MVDGYNIIFAWEELNDLAKVNIDAARDKLADLLRKNLDMEQIYAILEQWGKPE